ncbi:MAG TPA: prepilin-type N-terminal cleavage/methylation domain-containing protein [Nevskiaceae bacterium]|nr:prepilin-type N-terminal cleavage/methylation domain-containing protein [Nevskiaceae bacterium]
MTRGRRAAAAGFTLIEVMVVMLIIGILVTFASLSISGRNVDDTLEGEARRLEKLAALALEEAALRGQELGLRSVEGGYEFLLLSPEGRWQALGAEGPLKPRTLPPPLTGELAVEGRPVKPAKPAPAPPTEVADGSGEPFFDNVADRKVEPVEPQVLLLSSGEATAFTYDIGLPGHPVRYRVEADSLGQLSRRRVEAEEFPRAARR